MLKPLTLGDLVEAIRDLEQAERNEVDARRALGFGGNAQTMENKHRHHEETQQRLADLRARPTNIVILES